MGKKISKSDKEIIIKSFVAESNFPKACWTQNDLPKGFDYYFSETPFQFQREIGKQQVYRYITNPDGSIRWFFPAELKTPVFLDLYNSAGLKAKLFRSISKLLFLFKLSFLIAPRKFYLVAAKPILQEGWKKEKEFDSFSVFTGTTGPNRKVLFSLHKNKKTIGFVKHSISYESALLVANETVVLNFFKETKFLTFSLPNTSKLQGGDLFISDIRKENSRSESEFTNQHALALQELYSFSNEKIALENTLFYNGLKQLLNGVHFDSDVPFHREMCDQLYFLFELLNPKQKVDLAWAHMDFTPWNLFADQAENHLGIIDWELSKPGIPMLFDAFHFVFQSQILLKKQDFKSIFKSIEQQVKSNSVIQDLICKNNIDVELHYRLYLLYNISYYLNIYQKQTSLHLQVNWLTKVWKDALATEIKMIQNKSFRTIFIADLFRFLFGKNYVWLHACDIKIKKIKLHSDLDLLVDKSVQKEILEFCKSHVLLARTNNSKKSFMATVELFFLDGSFLSLDLISRLIRKHQVFMDTGDVLKNSILNSEGICVPSKEDDLNYLILFYTLNHSTIPEKYQQYYFRLSEKERTQLAKFVRGKYALHGLSLRQLFRDLYLDYSEIKNFVSGKKENKGILFVKNTINYFLDTARSLMFKKGLVVTFSGVDGAGKSTLINDLALRLKNDYRKKVVVLRHRPSLLPILSVYRYGKKEAEQQAANTLPHQGKNKAGISSVLRFFYYFLDYLVGQIYVRFRFLFRNYIVIYDRYYFDFINDSRRSNIVLQKKFIRSLYLLIYKPKYNFFLYAKPEVIRERKKELSEFEITQLTVDYLKMFTRFKKKYHTSEYYCIENINREKTLEEVLNRVVTSL